MVAPVGPVGVVVSLADARGKLPMDKLLDMKLSGVVFDHLASVYEEYTGKIALENLRPSWLIFSEGFRKSPVLTAAKRAGDILAASRRYVRECLSPGDLALLHLTVPHPPIVFDAEGGESRYGREDPAGYPDQLRYADRLFGGLVDELKQAGRWDGSWVILMSDHGSHFQDWSADPAEKRHVPFMVKAPGQAGRQDLREPNRLADFGGIPGFPPGSARKGE